MRNFRAILPDQREEYRGTKASFWFLVALNVLVTVRSLIHMLAADGGANSIAGLNVDGAQGDNLISIFSTWGLSQLLLALATWAVVARYRPFVPMMLALNLVEQGRSKRCVATIKPPLGFVIKRFHIARDISDIFIG